MGDFSTVALFCDDIRPESAGTETIVGVFPDRINIPEVPGAFSKFAVYVRVNIFGFEKAPRILISVKLNDDVSVFENEIKTEIIENGLIKSESDYTGIVSRMVQAPFQVSQFGTIRAIVSVDGKEKLAGELHIGKSQ